MVTKTPPRVFNVFWNGPLVKLNEFEQPNLRAYCFFHVFWKGVKGEKLRAYCIFHAFAFGKATRGEMLRAYRIFHACWTICFSWLYQKYDYGWDVLENLQRLFLRNNCKLVILAETSYDLFKSQSPTSSTRALGTEEIEDFKGSGPSEQRKLKILKVAGPLNKGNWRFQM